MSVIKAASAALFAVILSIGVMMTPPAEAQTQNGLVNVYIDDTLNHNNIAIGVAANLAATVCAAPNVQVGVVAAQVARTGRFACQTAAGQEFEILQAQ